MKYKIVTIGQLKRGFLRDGCDFYKKRLSNYTKVEEIEVKESSEKDRESEALLKKSGNFVIALDERGEQYTSKAFANYITQLENKSISEVSLLIGGADGHSDELKAKANKLISLSKATLPHELARMMLFEQLYRIESIRAGHPYHRE